MTHQLGGIHDPDLDGLIDVSVDPDKMGVEELLKLAISMRSAIDNRDPNDDTKSLGGEGSPRQYLTQMGLRD